MVQTFVSDRMLVGVYDSNAALGAVAAHDLAALVRDAAATRDDVSIILATGNSQLSFIEALCMRSDIPWDRVTVFHMDEYIGLSERHPASFRRYLREKLANVVHPRAFYELVGHATNKAGMIHRLNRRDRVCGKAASIAA